MKTIITLLIGCSLGLATVAIAQQPEGQESPAKKGGRAEKATQGATETMPKSNAAETRGKGPASTERKPIQPSATTETGAAGGGKGKHEKGMKSQTGNATGDATETLPDAGANATQPPAGGVGKGKHGRNATTSTAAETGAAASPAASAPMETGNKGKHGRGATVATSPAPAPSASAVNSPATATTNASPVTSATVATGANQTTATGGNAGATQGTVGKGGKKVETTQIQQIKQQHATFRAEPRPDKAPPVQFNASFRIAGSDRWQGPKYEVFRSYHPEWHERGWYHEHHGRVALISGGYYYWDNGYWYPAWGYDPGVAYYPYDGPIYVGRAAEPLDKVIANVQAELQDMGYYNGEVDGLLGPLTRAALRDYQADHGLAVTEVIDEPTLDALELG